MTVGGLAAGAVSLLPGNSAWPVGITIAGLMVVTLVLMRIANSPRKFDGVAGET